MNIRLLFVSAIVFIFASACKKSSDDKTPTGNTELLTQIVYTNSGGTTKTTTLKYDSQNRLIEYLDNSSAPSDNKISYDSNNRITDYYETSTYFLQGSQIANTNNQHTTYNYNTANTIVANITYYTNANSPASTTETFTLNAQGQVIRNDFGTNNYAIYTYDGAGNVLTESDYSNGTKLRYAFSYGYDQQKSSYSSQKGNIYTLVLPARINNPVMQTMVNASTTPSVTTTTTSTYLYDANGYPTKETRVTTTPGSAAITDVYTFSYITI